MASCYPPKTDPAAFLVALLASVRHGPFFIEVAPDIETLERLRQDRRNALSAAGETRVHRLVEFVVWHEGYADEAAAWARAAELRTWPVRLQRALVETTNPQWVDLGGVGIGFPTPWLHTIPEHDGVRHLRVSEL